MDINKSLKPILYNGKTYANWENDRNIASANLRTIQSIKTNNDYRKFLTNQADLLILKNQLAACDETGVCPAKYTNGKSSVNKYSYQSVYDNNKPYGYQDSNLKQQYLEKQKNHFL